MPSENWFFNSNFHFSRLFLPHFILSFLPLFRFFVLLDFCLIFDNFLAYSLVRSPAFFLFCLFDRHLFFWLPLVFCNPTIFEKILDNLILLIPPCLPTGRCVFSLLNFFRILSRIAIILPDMHFVCFPPFLFNFF